MTIDTLQATADAYMSAGTATTNYGTVTSLGLNNYDPAPHPSLEPLLAFDLTPYSSVQIASVTLDVYIENTGTSKTVDIYRVYRAWTETGVTWVSYNGTSNWGTAGCNDIINDRSNTSMGTLTLGTAAGHYSTTLVLSEFLSMMSSNNGFLLKLNGDADTSRYMSSRENATTAQRPTLAVDWIPYGNGVAITPYMLF